MLYLVYILRLFGKEIIPKKNSFCNYFVEHLKNGIIFEEGGGRGRERELLWSGWGELVVFYYDFMHANEPP